MANTAKKKPSVAGKRPSDDEISELLNVEHIGSKKTDITQANLDPVRPTPMVVRLDQMDTYTDNPRQGENPVFDDLYDRIIAQNGLTDVLQITRRPGSDKYILSAGGNTRLEALRKAFAETNDESFAKFYALYVPYENEYKLQINHHAENNQRAGTSFIENALHVLKIKHTAEDELQKTFNQSELVRELKSQGFSIDRKALRLYEYAVDHLVRHMPKTLYVGMGRPKIQDIKNIESKLRDYTEFKGFDADRFTLVFEQSLNDNDTDEGFMLDHFENDLIIRLSDGLNLDVGTFEYELDGYSQEGAESPAFNEPEPGTSQSLSDTVQHRQGGSLSDLFEDTDPSDPSSNQTKHQKHVKQKTSFERIEQLQKQAARIAERLAIAFKLTDCLHINHYGIGHGYWMDFPPDKRQLDIRQAAVWWHLYLCCGLTQQQDQQDDNQSIKQRAQALGDHIHLKNELINNPEYYNVFNERVGPPDQYTLTMYFLTDPDVEERLSGEYFALSSTCRELLMTANKNGLTQELWIQK